jgi:hypothetical protein
MPRMAPDIVKLIRATRTTLHRDDQRGFDMLVGGSSRSFHSLRLLTYESEGHRIYPVTSRASTSEQARFSVADEPKD